MSTERQLPTNPDIIEHLRRIDEIGKRGKIAGTVMILAGVATKFFPPAFGASLVGMGAAMKKAKEMDEEIINFHRKYPGQEL